MQENKNFDLVELLGRDIATLSNEELNFVVSYTQKLRAVTKVAKEKGVIAKTAARPEKTAEVLLLASAFEAVIEANLDVIRGLFPVSADKPTGAKGVNISTIDGCEFYIQILNRKTFKAEADAKKAEKEAAAAKEAEKKVVDWVAEAADAETA